jgi:hypothetical protein
MAGPQRKLEFIVTGDADRAIAALKQLAAAGKNTGGDLEKAGAALEKALGEGLKDVDVKPPAAAKGVEAGAAAGKKFGDAFTDSARDTLAQRIDDLLPGNFAGTLLEQLGGTDMLLGKIGGTTAVAAAGAATLGAAFAALGAASVRAYNDLGSATAQFQRQTGATAEVSSQMVTVAQSFGIGFDDLSGSVKDFGENISDRYDDLQKFGFQVARTSDGTVDFVGSMLNAIDVFNGLRDPIDRAAFASQAFGGEWEKLLPLITAGRAELEKRMDGAILFDEADLQRQREFAQATRDLTATVNELKVEFGRELVPLLTDVAQGFNAAVQGARDLKRNIETLGGSQPEGGFWSDLIDGWKSAGMSPLVDDTWRKDLAADQRDLAAATTISADAAEQHAMAAQGQTYWLELLQGEASSAAAATHDLANAALSAADKLVAASSAFVAFTANGRASLSTADGLADAYDALDSLLTASTKSAGGAADAASGLAEAQADGASAIADAHREAARRIADVEEQSAERIVDAQRRVQEARERAARSLEDANDRVQQALADLVDAQTQSGSDENPFTAARRVEEARKRVADAEKDLARTTEDSRADVADAEEELVKTTAEAVKDRQRAHEEAAERIARAEEQSAKRVGSAQKQVQSSYGGTTTSAGQLTSALQAVVDKTFDLAYWTRENGGSLEDVQKIVDESKEKIDQFAQKMGLSAEKTAELKRQLDLIPTKVNIEYVLRMNMTEFADAMRRAGAQFTSPETRAMFESGIIEVIGAGDVVPRFAEGGMFRTSAPGGAGLAILHDGERVIPADQSAGGTTIIVNGSVITERELGDILERQARRGFAGVR